MMTTNTDTRAAAAREQARENDGKFGEQQFDRASGIDLDGGLSAVDALDWPDGFDPHTAEPSTFDVQLAMEHATLSRDEQDLQRVLDAIHYDIRDRRVRSGRRMEWGMADDVALTKAARKASTVGTPDEDHGASLTAGYMRQHYAAVTSVASGQERIAALDDEYVERGRWNRAFLVANANGHVHSSMSCSTCRASTQYAWMTDYSGADEDAIVSDAGYRACTTCYPSAPVGDERTLPTKILSDEEKDAAQQRALQQEQRAAKKVAAASNAPTVSGEPIEIHYPSGRSMYVETLKTERAAQQWVTSHLVDQAGTQALAHTPYIDEQKQQIERDAAQRVIASLAEKRGVTRSEVVEEIRKKAIAKAKRDHREGLKHVKALGLEVDADAEERHARELAFLGTAWGGRA